MASRLPKAYYSEAEAARSLGISTDEFRTLLKRHIIDSDDVSRNAGVTTFHASDLVVLRLLTGRNPAPSSPALADAGPALPVEGY